MAGSLPANGLPFDLTEKCKAISGELEEQGMQLGSRSQLLGPYILQFSVAIGLAMLDPNRLVFATEDDPELRKAMLHAWQEFELKAKRWPKVTVRGRVWINGKLTTQALQVDKFNPNCRSQETRFLVTDSRGTSEYAALRCVNEAYAFELGRTSLNQPWRLQRIILEPRNTKDPNFLSLVKDEPVLCRIASIPFVAYLPDVLKLPGRVIYRGSASTSQSKLTLVIENRSGLTGQRLEERVHKLLIEVNTEYYYVPELVVWESGGVPGYPVKTAARGETRLRYRVNQAGLPIPIGHEGTAQETVFDNRTGQTITRDVRFINEYDVLDTDTVLPNSEFHLSYYGFPEPEELRWSRPTPWWLYILLAGLALVMLSFAIYAWRRHRRQQLALP
jgi:hypothetical protein